jgi:hypothetical protein
VESSILTSTKQMLGLPEDHTDFDLDIIMHINSVLSTLNQLGVGPEVGFMIEDKTATWGAFLGSDPRLNNVKTYVYLRVRMIFDPPNTGFTTEAMKKQIEELEWRMNVHHESTGWVPPDSAAVLTQPVLDGGIVG